MKKLILLLSILVLTGSALNDARKANEAFQQGDFERAAQLYRQAIEQNPDDARLYFNLGNALAQAGQTEEAIQAFSQFRERSEEPEKQSMADYNTGRTLADMESYDEAIQHFRNALRNNPGDADARHNYELAKQLKAQQVQQQQQDSDSDNQDENQDQDDRQDQNDQDSQQDSQQDQAPQDQQPDQQDQPQPQSISQDEAENILDALRQLERELLENRKKEATDGARRDDKDW